MKTAVVSAERDSCRRRTAELLSWPGPLALFWKVVVATEGVVAASSLITADGAWTRVTGALVDRL